MKRFALALGFALLVPTLFVGCGEEAAKEAEAGAKAAESGAKAAEAGAKDAAADAKDAVK